MNQVAVWTPRPQEVSYLVRQQIDGGGGVYVSVSTKDHQSWNARISPR